MAADRVALVTGAGSGIGQRIAIGLAEAGADLALLDRRSDDGLAQILRTVCVRSSSELSSH